MSSPANIARPTVQHYVCGFAFADDDVLLIEKQRPAWQRGLWNGVGGHLELHETPLAAMQREFAEETGLAVDTWEQVCTLRGPTFEVVCFRASCPSRPTPIQTTDERVQWWPIRALPNTLRNVRWLVPMAREELTGHGMPFTISVAERA